ncbi:MAG: Endonuclease [Polyangiaceae bacterium]|jgi:deoxyribonuclease V|nr:Endonuclease [Polyangiaceae bacterium]
MCAIALLDAHYDDSSRQGRVACLVAADWGAAEPKSQHVLAVYDVKPYRPGHFFERELPGLLAIFGVVREPLEAIVVDGYVDLAGC